ncbi:MAG: DNA gyrase inhibitor YacG [Alphaproteobacteria bacterium]|nr:DNA gyrase inhibitor YacG [Alphaproteobacteria bacterium]
MKTRRCPICHKLFVDDKYAPFCSKRCADVDLNHWFNGDYAVPSEDMDELDTEELSEALDNAEKDRK